MPDTMISAWLARYRRGLIGTIMDYVPNEKAPSQRLRGAFIDYLRLTLADQAGASFPIKSIVCHRNTMTYAMVSTYSTPAAALHS